MTGISRSWRWTSSTPSLGTSEARGEIKDSLKTNSSFFSFLFQIRSTTAKSALALHDSFGPTLTFCAVFAFSTHTNSL